MKQKLWYWLCKNVFILLSDKRFTLFIRKIQFLRLKIAYYPLERENKKTFSHYLLDQKLRTPSSLASKVADKVAVREFVASTIGEWILIPKLGIYDDASKIQLDTLPNQFIIKANHGSGWNVICRSKKDFIFKKESKKLNSWLKMNAYYLSREKQYKTLVPKLIIEELIGDNPNDYKFFCFKGKVKAIQVDSDRFLNHERTIFDRNWNALDVHIRYNIISKEIPKPRKFDDMITISEKLSAPFDFARIDLYEVNNQVFFGEITLFPGGGTEPFHSFEEDVLMREIVLN